VRAAVWTALVAALIAPSGASALRAKVTIPNGYVSIETPDEWTLISAKTHRSVASALFQIPNPSDEGTPDSTSIGVKVYDLKIESGRKSASNARLNTTAHVSKRVREGRWLIYRQHFADDGDPVPYTTLTARQDTPEMLVTVDLNWPKLPNNPADYDARMEQLFRAFIATVKLHAGAEAPAERSR
jgi:hypothetical protein